MSTSPSLGLPYLETGQAQKEVTHNEALRLLDAVVQLSVIAIQAAPPGSPTDGQRWIVGSAATGAWAGEVGKIALWSSGWLFLNPMAGWQAFVSSTASFRTWSGTAWLDTGLLAGRDTGWAAFTGTATKGGFATGTVTLPQLAQVVKALQDALTARGIIGS